MVRPKGLGMPARRKRKVPEPQEEPEVMDTSEDEALVAQGMSREVINRVQKLRKSAQISIETRARSSYYSTLPSQRFPCSSRFFRFPALAPAISPALYIPAL